MKERPKFDPSKVEDLLDSASEVDVVSMPTAKVILFDSKGNPVEAEEANSPQSPQSVPSSLPSPQSQQQESKKPDNVPTLNLPGADKSKKVAKKIPPHLLMTENEIRL